MPDWWFSFFGHGQSIGSDRRHKLLDQSGLEAYQVILRIDARIPVICITVAKPADAHSGDRPLLVTALFLAEDVGGFLGFVVQ